MLGYLSGRVIAVLDHQIILKLPSGVGYVVAVSPFKNYMVNENLELFVLEYIKEDRTELYGFESLLDRKWADTLTKVSGVGPKMAALIIFHLGFEKVIEAINTADSTILSEVKGLGVKTAKKIVLELKGATTNIVNLNKQEKNNEFAIDFADALSGLGYKRGEIVSTISHLKKVDQWDESNLVVTVKKGLEILGKK